MFIRLLGNSIAAVLFGCLFFSCQGPEYSPKNAPNETEIIGHAGMGFSSLLNPFNPLPENSMAALTKALELGADGIEIDVQLTKDSALILYHDNFLESKTSLSGCTYDHLASDIIGLPYENGFPFTMFHNEKIIGLDSLFNAFNKLEKFPLVYIDIHSYNYCKVKDGYGQISTYARAMFKAMTKAKVPFNKVFLTSTHVPMLLALRAIDANMQLLYEEHSNCERGIKIAKGYKFDGLVLKKELIPDSTTREEMRMKDLKVIYFGGKAKHTIQEMLQTFPEAIQVNNVKAMVNVIEKSNG